MRLDKLLAHCGFGTRKEVKEIIKKGFVSVNDCAVKTDKTQVNPNKDEVKVDGEVITYEDKVYYMLNKPDGYVSATTDNLYPTVVSLIDDYYRDDLFPVGRLDVDTEGLLLLTNDGQLAHQLLSPKKHCPKTYYAHIDGVVDESDIVAFQEGIEIDDYVTQPSQLQILNINNGMSEIEVTIYEGKYHQVKRMFLSRGKEVRYLKRIQMKDLKLDEDLELGEYRRLTDEEINRLKEENMIKYEALEGIYAFKK